MSFSNDDYLELCREKYVLYFQSPMTQNVITKKYGSNIILKYETVIFSEIIYNKKIRDFNFTVYFNIGIKSYNITESINNTYNDFSNYSSVNIINCDQKNCNINLNIEKQIWCNNCQSIQKFDHIKKNIYLHDVSKRLIVGIEKKNIVYSDDKIISMLDSEYKCIKNMKDKSNCSKEKKINRYNDNIRV